MTLHKMTISVDKEKAGTYGITMQQISNTLGVSYLVRQLRVWMWMDALIKSFRR